MTTNEQKLELLEEARRKVEELDKQKTEVFKEVRQGIGLSEAYDRDIWDFVISGLKYTKNNIQVALHTNEGKSA